MRLVHDNVEEEIKNSVDAQLKLDTTRTLLVVILVLHWLVSAATLRAN